MPQRTAINTETSNLLREQDILILSPSEWTDNAVSNMHIAALLSENNRVIYVETIGMRLPRISELGRVWRRLARANFGVSKRRNHRGLNPRNVIISSPLAIPLHGRPLIDWLNRKIVIPQVKRLLRQVGMKRPIIWTFSPRWESVTDSIDTTCLIFHCVDALHTYDSSPSFRAQFERTARAADIVFTPSVLLADELKRFNSSTFVIGHGCGLEHLSGYGSDEEPEDLAMVPKPRVVYSGTLANWVNYSLLAETARHLPQVSFVLIGYIHALTPRAEVGEVLALPNVYHLGYKNFAELPRYYCRSAVGLVPYKLNEHIRYSTPTKFLDYFAAGLPIVSTPFPAAVAHGDTVNCAETPAKFADAIERALLSDSPAQRHARRRYASEHTWEHQVEKMCECIRRVLHADRNERDLGQTSLAR